MATPTAKIQVKQLGKEFGSSNHSISVFRELSFEVVPNEFFCILGPSGCGKSTLLSILSGLLQPSTGEILIDGEPLNFEAEPNIGYVFQDPRLLPWRSVLHNVAFGLEAKDLPKMSAIKAAEKQIERVGLNDFKLSYPHQLSGGMRQRVALARVLATNPDILLMDEPFGALDFETRTRMQKQLLDLWLEEKRTIVFVTHDPYEAVYLADRIMILSERPATVRAVKTVTLARPRRWRDPETLAVYFEVLESLGDGTTT